MKLRPPNAPHTGSVLETMAIQLIRQNPNLPTPTRQVKVRHWYVDLAWPEQGVFLELDGEWHEDQPQSTLRAISALFEGLETSQAS